MFEERKREIIHRQSVDWIRVILEIFKDGIPYNKEWVDYDEIVDILNIVGKYNGNYTFLPLSGGIELDGAENKGNYIDLIGGSNYSVEPYRLMFEYFHDNPMESYFRLEGKTTFNIWDGKTPSSIEPVVDFSAEERVYREFGKYEGDHYSILDASFVIFNKSSHYNADATTVDGRHDAMTALQFRQYINRIYANRPARLLFE